MNKHFLTALLALLGCCPAFSQITYVTVNGAGNQSGSSWSNALPGSRLRSILLTSPPTAPNAQIWVAAGTYRPHPTSRDSFFYLAPSVKLYGGFAGTETQLGQRNWNTNLTVLSGDVGTPNDTSDNSYNVVRFNLSDGALVDGFTITGGNANGAPSTYQRMGGGVFNLCQGVSSSTSSPTLSNCRITKNFAIGNGGGLCNYTLIGTATVTLDNCVFDHNNAGSGGAIHSSASPSTLLQVPTSSTGITATHCTFSNSGSGGSVVMINAGSRNDLTFTGCSFTDNYSGGLGGAIYYDCSAPSAAPYTGRSATIRIDSCSFIRNVSAADGMAIYLNSRYLSTGDISISHTLFERNSSEVDYYGTVSLNHISSLSTNTRITGCRFLNNNRGRGGYPIYSTAGYGQGGNVNGSGTDSLLVANSFFYNNANGVDVYARAMDGARHYTTVANTTLYHDSTTCTFINSVRSDAYVYGGSAVPNSTESAMEVQNSILWHRLPNFLAGAQLEIRTYVFGLAPSAARIKTTNSIVTGALPNNWPTDYGTDGGGNSGLYPGFVDTAGMDFHLACGAYGIDKGSNALVLPAGLATDLAGAPRISNNTVDIGAFETDLNRLRPVASPVTSLAGGTLTYSYTAAADSVRWTFGDGGSSTSRSGNHTYQRSGTYTICLHAVNACGSRDSCFSKVVTVPSGSGVATVGGSEGLVLYPNPATTVLHLRDVPEGGRLRIFNVAGMLVHTAGLPAGKDHAVDISRLAAGTYLLELTGSGGTVARGRFTRL